MNIITNKEVFSEENQASIPKKINRRPSRPRTPGRTPRTSAPSQAGSTPQNNDKTDNPANKTVFYQASRPRTNGGTAKTDKPEASSQERSEHPNRPRSPFQTARRRPGRGALPQDNGGVFMSHESGELKTLGREQGLPKAPGKDVNLKIIPLGGLEEIGKNMTVFEYGDDIIIVDMGFMFPDGNMPGVDYIIPDVTYLEDKKDKIRGAVITHGHLDHIGAIPYLVQKLGFPTLYGTAITLGMARQRLEEFGLVGRNKLITIKPGEDVLQLGSFRIRTFRLLHSIPGAIGLEIETPNGRISYCTDWKFDYNPSSGENVDFQALASVGGRGVDLLFSDSTNAERPGHSVPEKQVEESIDQTVGSAKGRLIIAMFSTNLGRIQQTINVAHRHGRKVLVVGRSMQQNVEMAIGLKAIIVPPNTLVSEREINRLDDSKVLVLSTGAQGEDRSALSRMASGEHKTIKIRKGDTVVISASPIPGNERSVSNLMDVLYKAGASVVYNKLIDIHTSGHANQEDLKLMLALMKPKHFVPLHGERSKLMVHGKLAEEVGVKPENIIIGDNGLILEMDPTGKVFPTDNHVPAGYVMVDGLGVGDVGNIVLRDRQAMAEEGVFFIASVYDTRAKKFLNSPDIISRGFIYMRENEQFVNDVRQDIKNFLQKSVSESNKPDINAIRNELRDRVSKYLYEKTERQPMVIPVIIEV